MAAALRLYLEQGFDLNTDSQWKHCKRWVLAGVMFTPLVERVSIPAVALEEISEDRQRH